MSLNTKPLRISCLGDIHLGHKRNNTAFIIDNLNRHFSNDTHLSKIDIVFIEGDVFDDLLSFPSEDAGLIDIWISRLLRLCSKHNVIVRVLEGTPSHDRQQSDRFRIINEIHSTDIPLSADMKYIKTLCIEHIDKYNIDVLYVPDEWNHETNDTLNDVKELMTGLNLSFVDFAVVHGCFDYQMGDVIKSNLKHNSDEYLSLVKGLIFVGHIHQCSSHSRIHAAGSFDRLAHGEEESKGFLTAIVNPDYSYEMTFVDNYTARKFITIKCPYEDTELNLKRIDKKTRGLPPGSYIRIESKHTNAIVHNLDTLKRRWPLYHWSILLKDKDTGTSIDVFSEIIDYVPMILNKETLTPMVVSRIQKLNVRPDILDRCLLHLEELT